MLISSRSFSCILALRFCCFTVIENAMDAWDLETLVTVDGLESRQMYSGMFAVVHKGRQTAKRVKSFETL